VHLDMELHIPEDALVLEVGAGGFPHPRASIIVDKFPGEDGERQRGGASLELAGLDLVQADLTALPFADKQFDYVILSHVIEHIPAEDLPGAARELMRVARSGYIEAPSIVYEAIRQIDEHLWYVLCENDTVYLASKGDQRPQVASLLEPLFAEPDITIVDRRPEIFFTGIEWHDVFRLEIVSDLDTLLELYPVESVLTAVASRRAEEAQAWQQSVTRVARHARLRALVPPIALNIARRVRDARRRPVRGSAVTRRRVSWQEVCVCPACHAPLPLDSPVAGVMCNACGRRYPTTKQGVPVLLL